MAARDNAVKLEMENKTSRMEEPSINNHNDFACCSLLIWSWPETNRHVFFDKKGLIIYHLRQIFAWTVLEPPQPKKHQMLETLFSSK